MRHTFNLYWCRGGGDLNAYLTCKMASGGHQMEKSVSPSLSQAGVISISQRRRDGWPSWSVWEIRTKNLVSDAHDGPRFLRQRSTLPPPLTCCFLRILLSSHYGTKTTVSNACLMLNWRAPQKSRAKGMQTVSQLNSLPSRMAQRGREFVVIWIWTVVPVSQRFQQRMKMLLTNEVLSTHNNRRKKAWNSERCSPLWSSIHLHSAVFVPSASTTKSSALDTLECEKTTYCHLSVSPARKEETHWYR